MYSFSKTNVINYKGTNAPKQENEERKEKTKLNGWLIPGGDRIPGGELGTWSEPSGASATPSSAASGDK